jgi:hypothetical protein
MYKETALPDIGNFVSKDSYIIQSSSVQSRYIKHKTMTAQMYKETALPDLSNFMSKDTYILTSPNPVAYNLGIRKLDAFKSCK